MEEKNIIKFEKEHDIKQHPSIKNVQIIDGEINFSIDWIEQYEYCNYQIYLKYIKGINSPLITRGSEIQKQLDNIFKQESTPITFENAVEISKKEPLMSRDCLLISTDYGIRGNIDEIWMKPDEIVLIKDKQGRTPYESTMNEVKAYCLAFKNMTNDKRKIKAALRERGTENLFWIEIFTHETESKIKKTVNQIHDLINGNKEFKGTEDNNKCKKCYFKNKCEHAQI